MADSSGGDTLGSESGQLIRTKGMLGMQNLDSDHSPQIELFRFENDSHGPASNLSPQSVTGRLHNLRGQLEPVANDRHWSPGFERRRIPSELAWRH
jgi:hypothetical protein